MCYSLVLSAAMQMFMKRFGAGDQCLPFCYSCLCCQDNNTCLAPLFRNLQSFSHSVLQVWNPAAAVLSFLCTSRSHFFICFFHQEGPQTQIVLFLKHLYVETNLWKSNRPFPPSHTPEILIMLILLFMKLASAFSFDILSGEEEISIPCWSLCFAIVWLSVREQSDSPVCHLFLLGGLPEGRKCGDQRHFEQDATALSFFHSF